MMVKTLLMFFLISWAGFVIFLWASVFSKTVRWIVVLFMVVSLSFLLISVSRGYEESFPLQVFSYALHGKEKVIVGNSPDADITIFNPYADEFHLQISLLKKGFSLRNLSEKRRVEIDGRDLDVLFLSKGQRVEIKGGKLTLESFSFPLPFSLKSKIRFNGREREIKFFLHSKAFIKNGPQKWSLSYFPPSLLGVNLFFWELFLAIIISFVGLYFLVSERYLIGIALFSLLLSSFVPVFIFLSFPFFIYSLWKYKKIFPLVPVLIFFLLPVALQGKLAVKVRIGNEKYHFVKAFSGGEHTLILGKTPYALRVSHSEIELKPLGKEGFLYIPERIIFSPLKIKVKDNIIYLPFPKGFSPVNYKGGIVKLEGESGELIIGRSSLNLLRFSFPFLFLFFLYILSLILGTDFLVSSVFYFLLSLGGIFIQASGVFDPYFKFISYSYLRLGVIPAGILFLLFSPTIFERVRKFVEYILDGLSIRESFHLAKLSKERGINLFEFLNRPISQEILWVDLIFFLSLILIGIQFAMGSEAGIRGAGLSLQLFEAGKILLAIYLADWLFRAQENRFYHPIGLPYILIFIPFFLLIFTLGDFSPLAVFFPAIIAHFILVEKPLGKKFLLALIFFVLSAMGTFAAIHFLVPADVGLRLSAWLWPGLFSRTSEQYLRAFWLFKSGGILGNFPHAFLNSHSVPLLLFDFPLALFSANFGMIAPVLFFLTYLTLVVRFFMWGMRSLTYEERWNFYVVFFSHLVFLSQMALPYLILTGLLPIMGQPLPFLSKANSDLILFVLPFFLLNVHLLRREDV